MKKKNKKLNLSSEAALERALACNSQFTYSYKLDDDIRGDVELELWKEGKLVWADSLRRLGIGKRKPLKGIMKKVRKAVR